MITQEKIRPDELCIWALDSIYIHMQVILEMYNKHQER